MAEDCCLCPFTRLGNCATVHYIEGTSTCGTSLGSDVPTYLLVMMDGKSMMPRPKKPAKVEQALCNVLSRPLHFMFYFIPNLSSSQ